MNEEQIEDVGGKTLGPYCSHPGIRSREPEQMLRGAPGRARRVMRDAVKRGVSQSFMIEVSHEGSGEEKNEGSASSPTLSSRRGGSRLGAGREQGLFCKCFIRGVLESLKQ